MNIDKGLDTGLLIGAILTAVTNDVLWLSLGICIGAAYDTIKKRNEKK